MAVRTSLSELLDSISSAGTEMKCHESRKQIIINPGSVIIIKGYEKLGFLTFQSMIKTGI